MDRYQQEPQTMTKVLMLMEDEQFIEGLQEFRIMMQLYDAAIKKVRTKLEILDDEFQVKHAHNPIHHIESRLKSPPSIWEKLKRKGVPLSVSSIRTQSSDVAGIRVICNYLNDVFHLAAMLENQDDVRLLEKKDYIETPKLNGYRSLHLILQVPIFWASSTEYVTVEVQIRTIAMGFWASLEHHMRYKAPHSSSALLKERLNRNAMLLSVIDYDMQDILREISGLQDVQEPRQPIDNIR